MAIALKFRKLLCYRYSKNKGADQLRRRNRFRKCLNPAPLCFDSYTLELLCDQTNDLLPRLSYILIKFASCVQIFIVLQFSYDCVCIFSKLTSNQRQFDFIEAGIETRFHSSL